ncbi:MAG: ADOP family duplicated permease [Deltaproteobacteria bacterium]
MDGLLVDLRQSLRALLRERWFTLMAVAALAIGVGSSTAMFSVVDAALWRPLPYTAPERLIEFTAVEGTGTPVPVGAVEVFELQKRATTAEAVGAFYPHAVTLVSASGPRPVRAANVSASMFAAFGIRPLRGRAFEPGEDVAGGVPVAIVSDGFWRRELGADPAVLGRTIQVDHKSATVVGVLPPKVAFPRLERCEVLLPLAIPPEALALPAARSGLYGFARLKPGVTAAAARADFDSIVRATNGYGITVERLDRWVTGAAAPALRASFAAVLLLLVIACSNVALLLLMRGTARGRDLAIRAALGGGRRRVAFQQIAEGLVLALAGGALGLVLAIFAVRGLIALAPYGIPRLNEVRIDWRMGTFALLASLISGALAGAGSAWHAARSDLFLLLKEGGAGATPGAARSRLRDALVVAQLAFALLLGTGAGLLVRSLQRFAAVPLGFEPKDLMAAVLYPQGPSYTQATAQLLAAAHAIPGVRSAALVGGLPLDSTHGGPDDSVHVEGRNPTDTMPDVASLNWYSPGYLETAGIPLVRGRDFVSSDTADSAPVAIVNQTFVARYLSGREPIGALVSSYDWRPTVFTIVGVVQDVRQAGPEYPIFPELFLPQGMFARNKAAWEGGATLVVKTALPPGRVESALRAAAAPLASQLMLGPLRTLDDVLGPWFEQRRFQLDLAIAFAAAALGLAALGVYGSMAFAVVQRQRELAVRAALGAQARQLSRLVLARGARLALVGICLGVLGALALSRFLSALLFGIGERDPLTYAAVAVTLAIVALAASFLPARAAARVDPMTVLRSG